MTYHFEQRNLRLHLVFDDLSTEYSMLDSFLQVEGRSFGDIIVQIIGEHLQSGQPQTFAGNVYSLTLSETDTLIEDMLGENEQVIPTELFCEIFLKWMTELTA
ncbi:MULTISPECIES: hypothetical protein [unclassified Facklamia]|uniref:hypothetical protein n=1 Tax=Aerococcaceae TaxID=186827 RepID=UPI0013BA01D4|nr:MULTISPECIES: hypothetical protein [unclassified Facklamia]NEW64871.1 hypothetical protein [Facklamia sp. 252]NEW68193.1 hypothetical protein [Facklamia sp. 253]QQD66038.1 hypothetical protein JDW14_02635 [Aerococcaceae bacterium zg-252]